MKILLDTCIAKSAREELKFAGYDVEWSGEWPEDPGDEEILKIAYEQKSILVTLDKDFGELAVLHNLPHAGIIRIVGIRTQEQGEILKLLLMRYEQELGKAAIITASKQKVRIRL